MSIETMKQALAALEYEASKGNDNAYEKERVALRKAIANEALNRMAENARELGLDYEPVQAEKQEPVCPYCHDSHTIGSVYYDQNCVGCVRRMATPSKCQWVGLTQEDIDIAFDDTQEGGGFNEFARAIEQTLRSKNS